MTMQLFLAITCLLCISGYALGKGIRAERSDYDPELSYQELRNLNVDCYPRDSCEGEGKDDSPFPEFPHKCSCHSECWKYGTCCIDSPYRAKRPIQKCVTNGFHDTYFMYDTCPESTGPDSAWKNLCEGELDDESGSLIFSPVTSSDTSRTYKNYYCFRCHETTENYSFWNLLLTSSHAVLEKAKVRTVTYNQGNKAWFADLDEISESIPVNLTFMFPQNLQAEPVTCAPYFTIAHCRKTWTDEKVKEKCLAYAAGVYSDNWMYKNVHCAICNDVHCDSLTCDPTGGSGGEGYGKVFQNFVDINSAERRGKCPGENCLWNLYSQKCERVRQAYELKFDTKSREC